MSANKEVPLQTPSFSGLVDLWEHETIRLNEHKVKLRRRKLYKGNLINGLLAWFMAQEPEMRIELAREMMKCLEPWYIDPENGPNGGLASDSPHRGAGFRGVGSAKKTRANKADGSHTPVKVTR